MEVEEDIIKQNDIYNILSSNKNHDELFNKKIIKIRKDISIINSNSTSSICIVEDNQKKINFEIKDANNFLNKSQLISNIKKLNEKFKPIKNENENEKEKIRPNSSLVRRDVISKKKK